MLAKFTGQSYDVRIPGSRTFLFLFCFFVLRSYLFKFKIIEIDYIYPFLIDALGFVLFNQLFAHFDLQLCLVGLD